MAVPGFACYVVCYFFEAFFGAFFAGVFFAGAFFAAAGLSVMVATEQGGSSKRTLPFLTARSSLRIWTAFGFLNVLSA